MSTNTGVMSLAELDGYRSDGLSWNLAVPEYVPAGQVGVNVDLLGRVARLGGIGHVTIGAYAGDRSHYEPEASSIAPDGTGTASLKGTQVKAEAVRADIGVDGQANESDSEYWWSDAVIDVNTTELQGKISDRGDLRDARLWSRYLNADIKRGLSTVTQQQLLGNVSISSKLYAGMAAFLTVAFSPTYFSARDVPEAVLGFSTAVQFVTSYVSQYEHGPHLTDRRLSLIPGYQLDRLAVAQVMLRTRRLVKPLKTKAVADDTSL